MRTQFLLLLPLLLLISVVSGRVSAMSGKKSTSRVLSRIQVSCSSEL